jgi:hypothetical protein
MAKETFYFSHDYNARNDCKIKKLLYKKGMAGYGLFWAIVEDLYNNDNKIPLDYETMSYDFRCDVDILKSIINDFDLFEIDGGFFGSISVQSRLDARGEKSSKAKEMAEKRWSKTASVKRDKAVNCIFYLIKIYNENESFLKVGITTESISRRYSGKLPNYEYEVLISHDDSVEKCLRIENEIIDRFAKYTPLNKFAGSLECLNINGLEDIKDFAMQNLEFRNAIKESKVKESKVKDINIDFEFFWNLYDKKVGDKEKLKLKWEKLTDDERLKAMEHIPKYKNSQPDKKFRKDPQTYLNNKSFNDEIIGVNTPPVVPKAPVQETEWWRRVYGHLYKTYEEFDEAYKKGEIDPFND